MGRWGGTQGPHSRREVCQVRDQCSVEILRQVLLGLVSPAILRMRSTVARLLHLRNTASGPYTARITTTGWDMRLKLSPLALCVLTDRLLNHVIGCGNIKGICLLNSRLTWFILAKTFRFTVYVSPFH